MESLPQVRGDRIGCLGNGLGAQLALFTAALDPRIVATLCHGEFTIVGDRSAAESPTSPSFVFPEVIAAISPRSLSLRAPASTAVQDLEAMKQAVKRASEVGGLNRRAQLPTIDTAAVTDTSTEARLQAYEWFDGRLKGRGFGGR